MAKPKPEEVLEVFHYWIAQCKSSGKGRVPVLGDKRRRKIEKAIELYGLDACKDAIGESHIILGTWVTIHRVKSTTT